MIPFLAEELLIPSSPSCYPIPFHDIQHHFPNHTTLLFPVSGGACGRVSVQFIEGRAFRLDEPAGISGRGDGGGNTSKVIEGGGDRSHWVHVPTKGPWISPRCGSVKGPSCPVVGWTNASEACAPFSPKGERMLGGASPFQSAHPRQPSPSRVGSRVRARWLRHLPGVAAPKQGLRVVSAMRGGSVCSGLGRVGLGWVGLGWEEVGWWGEALGLEWCAGERSGCPRLRAYV